MNHHTLSADHLREQMRLVRQDLVAYGRTASHEVQQLQREVKQALDWREYIRNSPWLWGGLALGVGYWLIPAKSAPRIDQELLNRLSSQLEKVGENHRLPPKTGFWQSLLGKGVELATQYGTTLLMRQGIEFVKNFIPTTNPKPTQKYYPSQSPEVIEPQPYIRKHHA